MVVGILSLVLMAAGQLLLDTARTSFITAEKLDINADVRQFTLEMAENARAANQFFIYRSMNTADRNQKGDRLRDGRSGDLLVLIFQEPWPNFNSPEHYTRIVGYYRDADPSDPSSEGPVRRFEKRFDPYVSASEYTVEEMIADVRATASHATVVQLSRGLANGQLFYNYLDRSIILKAQIIHGNVAKRITDTYNYTVSPRG
jgi:hypothetical protein